LACAGLEALAHSDQREEYGASNRVHGSAHDDRGRTGVGPPSIGR